MWDLPQFVLPTGFRIRTFHLGDEWGWAEVETAAGEFLTVRAARDHFAREFGESTDELSHRCHFLLDPQGRIVGTATAWFGRHIDQDLRGRLHWVAIKPDYQGKGLAKPLVSRAMNRLAWLHHSAYLTTQTTSFKAIKIYLDFGFSPRVESASHAHGWKLMTDMLGHTRLSGLG